MPITMDPIRFRAPLMASADQGIILISSPPKLNATEARNTHRTESGRALCPLSAAFRFSRSIRFCSLLFLRLFPRAQQLALKMASISASFSSLAEPMAPP